MTVTAAPGAATIEEVDTQIEPPCTMDECDAPARWRATAFCVKGHRQQVLLCDQHVAYLRKNYVDPQTILICTKHHAPMFDLRIDAL